jgi:hypothetical protein
MPGQKDPVSVSASQNLSIFNKCCGFGAFFNPGSGMGKQSGSGSGMNNPDHISESSKTIFWIKILKFFNVDPGWKKIGSGMEKSRIRDPR